MPKPKFNFEELFETHKNMVYNLALNYLQNAEDAEEVTHDVFVAIHQKLNSFNQQASISTWVYRIAINKCLDFLKTKQRQKRFAIFANLFFDNSTQIKHDRVEWNHPGVLLEDKEALARLFAKINDLPPQQKTALLLLKVENKSQAETAEIMQISIKAVESLLQRAKQNLSKKINLSEGNNS